MAGRSHGQFLDKGLVQREDPSPPPKSSGLAWTDIFTRLALALAVLILQIHTWQSLHSCPLMFMHISVSVRCASWQK